MSSTHSSDYRTCEGFASEASSVADLTEFDDADASDCCDTAGCWWAMHTSERKRKGFSDPTDFIAWRSLVRNRIRTGAEIRDLLYHDRDVCARAASVCDRLPRFSQSEPFERLGDRQLAIIIPCGNGKGAISHMTDACTDASQGLLDRWVDTTSTDRPLLTSDPIERSAWQLRGLVWLNKPNVVGPADTHVYSSQDYLEWLNHAMTAPGWPVCCAVDFFVLAEALLEVDFGWDHYTHGPFTEIGPMNAPGCWYEAVFGPQSITYEFELHDGRIYDMASGSPCHITRRSILCNRDHFDDTVVRACLLEPLAEPVAIYDLDYQCSAPPHQDIVLDWSAEAGWSLHQDTMDLTIETTFGYDYRPTDRLVTFRAAGVEDVALSGELVSSGDLGDWTKISFSVSAECLVKMSRHDDLWTILAKVCHGQTLTWRHSGSRERFWHQPLLPFADIRYQVDGCRVHQRGPSALHQAGVISLFGYLPEVYNTPVFYGLMYDQPSEGPTGSSHSPSSGDDDECVTYEQAADGLSDAHFKDGHVRVLGLQTPWPPHICPKDRKRAFGALLLMVISLERLLDQTMGLDLAGRGSRWLMFTYEGEIRRFIRAIVEQLCFLPIVMLVHFADRASVNVTTPLPAASLWRVVDARTPYGLDFRAPKDASTWYEAEAEIKRFAPTAENCRYRGNECGRHRHSEHKGLHFTDLTISVWPTRCERSSDWEPLLERVRQHMHSFLIENGSPRMWIVTAGDYARRHMSIPGVRFLPGDSALITEVRGSELRIEVPLIRGSTRTLALWRLLPWFIELPGIAMVFNGRETWDAAENDLIRLVSSGRVPLSINRATSVPYIASAAARTAGELSHLRPLWCNRMELFGDVYGSDEAWLQELPWYSSHPWTTLDRAAVQPADLRVKVCCIAVDRTSGLPIKTLTYGMIHVPSCELGVWDGQIRPLVGWMGTRGDRNAADMIVTLPGCVAKPVALLSESEGTELLRAAENGVPLDRLDLLVKASRNATRLPYGSLVPSTVVNVSHGSYSIAPSLLNIGVMTGGFSRKAPLFWTLGLKSLLTRSAIRFGGLGPNGLHRRWGQHLTIPTYCNYGLKSIRVWAGSSTVAPPAGASHYKALPAGDHSVLLRGVGQLICHGGVGIMSLCARTCTRASAYRKHPDSDYLNTIDFETTSTSHGGVAALTNMGIRAQGLEDWLWYTLAVYLDNLAVFQLLHNAAKRAKELTAVSGSVNELVGNALGAHSMTWLSASVTGALALVALDTMLHHQRDAARYGAIWGVLACRGARHWVTPILSERLPFVVVSPCIGLGAELSCTLVDALLMEVLDLLTLSLADPTSVGLCIRLTPVGPLIWHADLVSVRDNLWWDPVLDHGEFENVLTQYFKPMRWVRKTYTPRRGQWLIPCPGEPTELSISVDDRWRWSPVFNCITGVISAGNSRVFGLGGMAILCFVWSCGVVIGSLLALLAAPVSLYYYGRQNLKRLTT